MILVRRMKGRGLNICLFGIGVGVFMLRVMRDIYFVGFCCEVGLVKLFVMLVDGGYFVVGVEG